MIEGDPRAEEAREGPILRRDRPLRLLSSPLRPGAGIAVLMAIVAVVYLPLALRHRLPVIYADEAGFLGNARWLVGGERWWMDSASFYGLGYPLLLVPVFAAVQDPELLYRSVLLVNVVLCAVLALLLYFVTRRIGQASPRVAIVAALVGMAYPAIAAHVGIAWVEVTASVGVAALVLTAVHALARPSMWSFSAQALVVVWLVAVHGRFTLLAPTSGLLFAVAAVRRRDLRAAGALALLIVAAGWWVVARLHEAALVARWDTDANRQPVSLREILAAWPVDLLRSTAGQLWYVAAATAGAVVLGLVVLVRSGVRPAGETPGSELPADGRERGRQRPAIDGWPAGLYLAAMVGAVVAASVATIAAGVRETGEAVRVDYIFYGRYNDVLVPTLVALGVSSLFQPGARRWVPRALAATAVAIGLLGATTVLLRGDISYVGLLHPLAMPALAPFLGIGPGIRVDSPFIGPVTIGAIALTAVLAMLARVRPAAVAAVLFVGFAWIAYRDVVPASKTLPNFDAAGPVHRELRDRRPATVAYDLDEMVVNTYYGLPLWLDEASFVSFRASSGTWPAADLYVGPQAWPAASARGLQLLTVDPITKQGYWVRG